VFFAKDESGKTQILDASAPVYWLSKDRQLCIRQYDSFVSHFATCPDAGQHSKKKKPPAKTKK
jgi:hypothetical protein